MIGFLLSASTVKYLLVLHIDTGGASRIPLTCIQYNRRIQIMNYNLHASINNVVDHVFSLRDQLLLEKEETVELLKQARQCQSIDDVLNLDISDPEDFLVTVRGYLR